MAEIKDGVYGYVSGTVVKAFNTKNGRALEVTVKDDRQQYGDRWTVWGDLAAGEGDRVTVEGWLSTVREPYEKDGETKVGVKRSVNKPKLKAHEAGSAQAVEPADTWNTASTETPF
jgi:hypothetical protein